MSITNLLRLVFNLWKIWDFIHYFWLCLHKGSPISITSKYSKRALLTCPYQFYLVALILNSIENSFIVFWLCLHKLSHLFSHLKTKNNVITKLFHKAFRKCIQLLLRSSPKSQTSFKDMLEPKRSKYGPTSTPSDGPPQ